MWCRAGSGSRRRLRPRHPCQCPPGGVPTRPRCRRPQGRPCALGSIGAAVGAGFAFGRIAGVSFQSSLFAWAAATAGLWFLFDKAEAAMSTRSRKQVVGWLRESDLRPLVASIPTQFATVFDRVFGERHWSMYCSWRVTDVERKPFRSMRFVSVIIVSALFTLGLPLVLL